MSERRGRSVKETAVANERTRRDLRQYPPLARRDRARGAATLRRSRRGSPPAPPGVVPKRGQGDVAERIATFRSEAERAQRRSMEVARLADVPAEVARYLRDNNCPRLCAWEPTRGSQRCRGAKRRSKSRMGRRMDAISTRCAFAFAGIAETGTLALVSGPDNPTTLNFLPDNEIVVVSRDEIEADYESVFAKLRRVYGKGASPAHVEFHHRAFPLGRHRADAAAGRSRAAASPYRDRGLSRRPSSAPRKPLWNLNRRGKYYVSAGAPLILTGALGLGSG